MSLSCEFGACIGELDSFVGGGAGGPSFGSCVSQAFGISGGVAGTVTVASLPTLSTGVKIGESPTWRQSASEQMHVLPLAGFATSMKMR